MVEEGREGEKERERRGWTGWWRTAGRSSPFVSLRQDTQVLSPIVFRCRLLHASLRRPATTPLRLLRRLVRKLSALVPGLFMPRWTTRHVAPGRDTIRDGRAPCLGGSMVRELLEKLPVVGKNPKRARHGDGEFIVAPWVPLLPIRFRVAGSRMRKEATGSLSVLLLRAHCFETAQLLSKVIFRKKWIDWTELTYYLPDLRIFITRNNDEFPFDSFLTCDLSMKNHGTGIISGRNFSRAIEFFNHSFRGNPRGS